MVRLMHACIISHIHTCLHKIVIHTHTYIHTHMLSYMNACICTCIDCGAWWPIGRVDAFRPKGHGLDSRSSRHVGALGKSFTLSSLWRFGLKLRHMYPCCFRSASGYSISLEEALYYIEIS